jgi:hypothetical protein
MEKPKEPMIRHQIARILSAIADRIEPDPPKVEIRYVYVYSAPQITHQPYCSTPWINQPNTCAN